MECPSRTTDSGSRLVLQSEAARDSFPWDSRDCTRLVETRCWVPYFLSDHLHVLWCAYLLFCFRSSRVLSFQRCFSLFLITFKWCLWCRQLNTGTVFLDSVVLEHDPAKFRVLLSSASSEPSHQALPPQSFLLMLFFRLPLTCKEHVRHHAE